MITDTMTDDVTLLRGFVEQRSEQDFARLVERHIGLVFATAVRRVGGDAHLAEDVTQSVFVDLARKARALLHHRILAGWLYTSTIYAAAKAVRSEQRRRHREQQAHAMQELQAGASTPDADWASVRPAIDDALRALNARDRDAILLRFFHAQGFADIGVALNLSENAARMRVERALEKLRGQLARRGIASTLAALGATLSAHAAIAPPATLAATITTSALAGVSSAGTAVALFNLLAMTKIQLGLATAVITVGVTTLALEHREQNELRATIAPATAIADESAQVRAEIARLKQSAADYQALDLRAATEELDQLRREAAQLRERRAHLNLPAAFASRSSPPPSASAVATPSAFKLAELDQMPRSVRTVAPLYPPTLAVAAIPGEVLLSFIVDAQGRVQDVKVMETTHPDFVAPSLDAIRQWEFASGIKGGKSVNTRVNQVVVFEIENPNWF